MKSIVFAVIASGIALGGCATSGDKCEFASSRGIPREGDIRFSWDEAAGKAARFQDTCGLAMLAQAVLSAAP